MGILSVYSPSFHHCSLKTELTVGLCDVTQGVVMSEEELRRTFLQPEEAGPQHQGEEPVEGLRHADLLGENQLVLFESDRVHL